MYLVQVIYKDGETFKPQQFKGVERLFREPKENVLTLVGEGLHSLVNIPWDLILQYQVTKYEVVPAEEGKETTEDVEPTINRKIKSAKKKTEKEENIDA